MTQWIIYIHTSTQSKKSYVGLTKNTIERRWVQHKSDAKNGSALHFHNAIRAYGIDNWTHSVLAGGINSLEEAIQLEKYYINKHDTFENGYNLTIGGEGCAGKKWTQEEKDAADSTRPVYKFIHFEHGIEELTLIKMCSKYNMSKGTLHGVIRGGKSAYYGWQMYNCVGDNPTDFSDDLALYSFSHEVFGDKQCTCRALSDEFNLMYSRTVDLVVGKQRILKGWVLLKNKGKNPLEGRNSIPRLFKHRDGEIFKGSTAALVVHMHGSSGSMTQVVKGTRKHHKGWSYICDLADLVEAVIND